MTTCPPTIFKKAPEAFRKRAWNLIKIILEEHIICSEESLEARVVLLVEQETMKSKDTKIAAFKLERRLGGGVKVEQTTN